MLDRRPESSFFLFADIPAARERHDAASEKLLRDLIETCLADMARRQQALGGKLLRNTSHALLYCFAKSRQALKAAIELQEKMPEAGGPDSHPPSIRIGLHVGEKIPGSNAYNGQPTTVVARLASLAEADQILATDAFVKTLPWPLRRKAVRLDSTHADADRLHMQLHEIPWCGAPPRRPGTVPGATEASGAANADAGMVVQDTTKESTVELSLRRDTSQPTVTAEAMAAAQAAANAARHADAAAPDVLDITPTAPDQVQVRVAGLPPTDKMTPPGGVLRLVCHGKMTIIDAHRPFAQLGRTERSDIVLQGQAASRSHAEIELRRGEFYLIDHSWNGTFVYDREGYETHAHHCELRLTGCGVICPGAPGDTPDAEAITFACGTTP